MEILVRNLILVRSFLIGISLRKVIQIPRFLDNGKNDVISYGVLLSHIPGVHMITSKPVASKFPALSFVFDATISIEFYNFFGKILERYFAEK